MNKNELLLQANRNLNAELGQFKWLAKRQNIELNNLREVANAAKGLVYTFGFAEERQAMVKLEAALAELSKESSFHNKHETKLQEPDPPKPLK